MCCKKGEWMTIIGVENEEDLEHLINVCEDIKNVDREFRYAVYPSKFEKYRAIVIIFSKDRDTAYKRGVWFSSKVQLPSGKKLLFWVKRRKKR